MSRRSTQFAKVAASGPVMEFRNQFQTHTVRARFGKNAEGFAAALPRNMKSEKRARLMARFFPRGATA